MSTARAGRQGWRRRQGVLAGVSAAAAGVLALPLLAAPALAHLQPPGGGSAAGLSPMALRALHHLGPPPRFRAVPGHYARRAAAGVPRPVSARPAPPAVWPAAGTAVVTLPAPVRAGRAAAGWTRAGTLSLSAVQARAGGAAGAAVSRVRVRIAPRAAARAAGAAGFAFTIARADGGAAAGPVRVRIDYGGFASAYGAGFASGLMLVAMPGCALTSPAVAACRVMRPLPAANDFAARSLTAQVTAPPAGQPASVIALTSSTSNSTGDFKATSLTPSSTWQVGLQSGNFTWSYPMRVPPPIGGAAPRLGLAYDSGSVDGETAQSNSQPGQLGEGFSLAGGGFIERKYAACADQIPNTSVNKTSQTNKTGDLCWDGNNAYLSLGGRTTQIIQDTSGTWRLAADDGSTIQELSGATNFTHNGEYWKLVTPDGTQYFFGLNEFPAGASGQPQTHSAWTVPVAGLNGNDNNSDGCYHPGTPSDYAKDVCTAMAWRWNLDEVIDPNGNTTEYFYNPQANYYSFDSYVDSGGTLINGTKMSYTAGGTLASIAYGLQSSSPYATQPFKVSFGYSDRCTLTTSTANSTPTNNATCDAHHDGSYWPDTPWWLSCSSTDTCTGVGHSAPSFFDTLMLTSVTTQVNEGSAGWVSVDDWQLAYTWQQSETLDLFLSSIQHTGDVGGSTSAGTVTFTGTALINRVPGDGKPAMTRWRIGSITTETGARINVAYNNGYCSSPPPAPSSDTQPCFQQYWADGDIGGQVVSSWFYKYPVSEVDVSDQTGRQPLMPTYYYYNTKTTNGYQDGVAWHYDTDIDLVLPKYKSYSQWRGYQHVFVSTGSSTDTQSETDYRFFRGMDGDPVYNSTTGTWGTQPATVTDSRGTTYTDSGRANGFLLEKITRNGPGGTVVSDQISKPWISPATATSATQPWGGTLTAQLEGTAQTDTYAPAVSGTRHTQVVNSFDQNTGLLTQTDDEGDVAVAAQELCTTYSYAQNATLNLLDYPKEVKVTSGACGASSPPLVSDNRYLYDGGAFGAAPTSGNITETDVYSAGDPGVAGHWVQRSRDGYDSYGRLTSTKDAAGNLTTTSYTSSLGPKLATTQVKVTDPLGHVTTTNLNPEWGSPKDITDPSGEMTKYQYDPLGRVTSIWLPGQSQPKGQTASYIFAYNLSSSVPSCVTTGRLINATGNNYVYTYQFFDSLLRPLQTQAPAEQPHAFSGPGTPPQGVATDTFYDSRGNVAIRNGPYPISPAPSTHWYQTTESQVPNETAYSYDGVGRLAEQDLDSGGVLQWKTTYAYPGVDAVTVTPPHGGTATTTYTDARGHTTDIYQYHSSPPPASPPAAGTGSSPGSSGWDHTGYGYTPAGQLTGITDPAGNTWSYGYDLLGRQITATTPDTGTATSTYNDLSQLTSVTDARGKTISYAYDAGGRKTFAYDTTGGAAPGPGNELDAWTYDTAALTDPGLPSGSQATGQLASATAYVGGTSGESYTQTINNYDPTYHPTSTTYQIQGNTLNSALDGSYTFTASYNTDGTLATQGYPAGGGLPIETVTHIYDNMGVPYSLVSSLNSGQQAYVTQTYYTPDALPAELDLGTGTGASSPWSQMLYYYDPATERLTEATIKQQQGSTWATITDTSYGYDNAANVTKISDSVAADTQCLKYDYAQRLTAAWAQSSATCPASPPGPSGTGGPAPYLQQLSYDNGGAGNMTENDLTVPGTIATTTLTYPQPGQTQPHTPSTITTTVNGTATTSNPAYNAAGQLHTTGTGATAQTFTWNTAGQLAAASDGTSDTIKYRYDAAGTLLLRQDNTATTLYLPGEEITATGTSKTATRYYSHAGQIVAARTPAALTWLFADPHGTDTLAIDTATQNITQRRFTPFGAPRGTPPAAWPSDHGFAGGTTDTVTGLTNLGAREYNPGQATFLSPDPVLAPYTPQDLNPYAYAQYNPATLADPTGLHVADCSGGYTATGCQGGGTGNQTNPGNHANHTTSGGTWYPPYYPPESYGPPNDIQSLLLGYTQPPPPPVIHKPAIHGLPGCVPFAMHTDAGPCTPPTVPTGGSSWNLFSWVWHHRTGAIQVGLGVGVVALTIINAVQGGLDPATDSAEVADASALANSLRMTSTVEQHLGDITKTGELARPYLNSPLTIRSIMEAGEPVTDPGGVPGGLRWDVPGGFRGSPGTWQLVIDPSNNTILHFLFTSGP